MKNKPKVFVGVSGGVDSSVALALLQKATPNNFEELFGRPIPEGFKGYDVTGVFLKVWHPEFLPCDWREERRSAMRVCATLGVPFLTIDCEKEYKKEVGDYMIREYSLGRVPNPDVFCNKYVKFGIFLDKARELGADFVATGHYAKVREKHENGGKVFTLSEAEDKNKDQSYFLYTLGQKQLAHTLFPLGNLNKPEVRKFAGKFDLPTATKKDSQGLCFIGKVDMKDFLSHYIEKKKGNVLNTLGKIIGGHDGSVFYTIGQRHGFTITDKTAHDPRYFVISKDVEKNTITVANKEADITKVYSTNQILIPEMHFIGGEAPVITHDLSVRIRYRQEKQVCKIRKTEEGYLVEFKEPQNGVAIGQSAVLYDGNTCLGGGVIEKTT